MASEIYHFLALVASSILLEYYLNLAYSWCFHNFIKLYSRCGGKRHHTLSKYRRNLIYSLFCAHQKHANLSKISSS